MVLNVRYFQEQELYTGPDSATDKKRKKKRKTIDFNKLQCERRLVLVLCQSRVAPTTAIRQRFDLDSDLSSSKRWRHAK